MRTRALAKWLLSARAAGLALPDMRLVTVDAREDDGVMFLAVTAADGNVLAQYRIGRGGTHPRLTASKPGAIPAPTPLARSRAVRAASSAQVTASVALRSRGQELGVRGQALRSRSAPLLARSGAVRAGHAAEISRSQALRARSQELMARSRALRLEADVQFQRALGLHEQALPLRLPAPAA